MRMVFLASIAPLLWWQSMTAHRGALLGLNCDEWLKLHSDFRKVLYFSLLFFLFYSLLSIYIYNFLIERGEVKKGFNLPPRCVNNTISRSKSGFYSAMNG
jgi:hypothetical protein